jgi:hypothetical protein
MKMMPVMIIALLILTMACEIMPRNTLSDCQMQCRDSKKSKACFEFCDCIHKEGLPLDSCLDKYNKASEDSIRVVGLE